VPRRHNAIDRASVSLAAPSIVGLIDQPKVVADAEHFLEARIPRFGIFFAPDSGCRAFRLVAGRLGRVQSRAYQKGS